MFIGLFTIRSRKESLRLPRFSWCWSSPNVFRLVWWVVYQIKKVVPEKDQFLEERLPASFNLFPPTDQNCVTIAIRACTTFLLLVKKTRRTRNPEVKTERHRTRRVRRIRPWRAVPLASSSRSSALGSGRPEATTNAPEGTPPAEVSPCCNSPQIAFTNARRTN